MENPDLQQKQKGRTMARWTLRDSVTIFDYERGLMYRDGKMETLLQPGRYRFWRWENVRVTKVGLRQMSQVISGQEILTADRVEVRISLVVQYVVADPVLAINTVESFSEQLYQELQLVLRELVAARTLDQMMEARAELGSELMEKTAASAQSYGITLKRVGIRDIVLPGNVRTIMLKEVEADRQARADLLKARGEIAVARAKANTAKIMAENPNSARLQELDALVQLAGRSGNVVMLPNLAELFVPRAVEPGGNGEAAS
jgi:regulator of protease activity HflC (stomatin/prohibitin superfamily)